jgi:hypothetical protein
MHVALVPLAKLLAPPENLTDVNPSLARHRRRIRPRHERRRNNPFLLGFRPSTPALHRRDHLDTAFHHRTIPRNSPMTSCLLPSAQDGLHRTRTINADCCHQYCHEPCTDGADHTFFSEHLAKRRHVRHRLREKLLQPCILSFSRAFSRLASDTSMPPYFLRQV